MARIDILRTGCLVSISDEALVREVAGGHEEVVIHVAEQGIKAASAVVIDGLLLGSCNNAGPDRDGLLAGGAGPPPR